MHLFPLSIKNEDGESEGEDQAQWIEVDAVFDTGALYRWYPRNLKLRYYDELPEDHRYDLPIEKDVKVSTIGIADAIPELAGGYRLPLTHFPVSDEVRNVVIGRPELVYVWDIIFTPEGPRPRKYPIELLLPTIF